MRNAGCMIEAASAAGLRAYMEDDLGWVVAPTVAHPAINAVRPLSQHGGLVNWIPEVLATYPDDIPVSRWVTSDDGRDELVEALGRANFTLATAMPVVAGPLSLTTAKPTADVVLSSPVGDDDWADVAAVQRDGFGLPADVSATVVNSIRALGEAETGPPTIEVVLARRGGTPVGVGFVSHRADVAGLWSLATMPAARGTGVGTAVVEHRLAQARIRGAEIAFMFSGGDAESLYAARGFRRIGICEVHVLAPRA
jgi:GNAT superfamily N-acetyltransferase